MIKIFLGHFKDPQGTTFTVRNLRLSIQDINVQPPEPSIARKMLNDSVSSEPCERTTIVRIGTLDLSIPVAVPWFEAWREMFLNVQFPSDHEFTKHFLACMIVVSTSDDNPLEKIQQMAAGLHQSPPGKLPKWFNNNVLRYYILVHDATQDDKSKWVHFFSINVKDWKWKAMLNCLIHWRNLIIIQYGYLFVDRKKVIDWAIIRFLESRDSTFSLLPFPCTFVNFTVLHFLSHQFDFHSLSRRLNVLASKCQELRMNFISFPRLFIPKYFLILNHYNVNKTFRKLRL